MSRFRFGKFLEAEAELVIAWPLAALWLGVPAVYGSSLDNFRVSVYLPWEDRGLGPTLLDLTPSFYVPSIVAS